MSTPSGEVAASCTQCPDNSWSSVGDSDELGACDSKYTLNFILVFHSQCDGRLTIGQTSVHSSNDCGNQMYLNVEASMQPDS